MDDMYTLSGMSECDELHYKYDKATSALKGVRYTISLIVEPCMFETNVKDKMIKEVFYEVNSVLKELKIK